MIEQLPLLDKRWSKRVQTFVVPSVTVDPTAYTIAPISTHDAREFVTTHHYSGTFPASRCNVGLLRDSRLRKMLFARFLFDPVFYFYMFWIPQFLTRERHLSLQEIGSYIWIPFLVLGFSQVFSGRLADGLVSARRSSIESKRLLLTISALATPVSLIVSLSTTTAEAIALMSVLLFAHGIWITNYLGMLSDLFDKGKIATIVGLTGTAGGIGGMLSTLLIGPTVDRFSFAPVFVLSGILYPLALLIVRNASSNPKERH